MARLLVVSRAFKDVRTAPVRLQQPQVLTPLDEDVKMAPPTPRAPAAAVVAAPPPPPPPATLWDWSDPVLSTALQRMKTEFGSDVLGDARLWELRDVRLWPIISSHETTSIFITCGTIAPEWTRTVAVRAAYPPLIHIAIVPDGTDRSPGLPWKCWQCCPGDFQSQDHGTNAVAAVLRSAIAEHLESFRSQLWLGDWNSPIQWRVSPTARSSLACMMGWTDLPSACHVVGKVDLPLDVPVCAQVAVAPVDPAVPHVLGMLAALLKELKTKDKPSVHATGFMVTLGAGQRIGALVSQADVWMLQICDPDSEVVPVVDTGFQLASEPTRDDEPPQPTGPLLSEQELNDAIDNLQRLARVKESKNAEPFVSIAERLAMSIKLCGYERLHDWLLQQVKHAIDELNVDEGPRAGTRKQSAKEAKRDAYIQRLLQVVHQLTGTYASAGTRNADKASSSSLNTLLQPQWCEEATPR